MGKRGPNRNVYRDQRIVRLYKLGFTLQEIGDEYGITRERVRQIVDRNNVTSREGGSYIRANRKCAVDYCDKTQRTKGYCLSHYGSLKRYGDPTYMDKNKKVGCMIPGCDKEHKAIGLCYNHYMNYKYHARKNNISTIDEFIEYKTSS